MSKRSKVTTKNILPKPTEEQQEFEDLSLEAVRGQLEQLRAQFDFQTQLFQAATPEVLEQLKGQITAEQPNLDQQRGARESLLGLELERAATGVATPEQRAAINESANLAIAAGASDIDRATRDQLELIREELAPGAGLRGTDTPILDRGSRLAEEALRQRSQLIRNVRSTEQGQLIDASQRQGALNQSLLGSADALSNNAATNRLNLLRTAGELGLGLARTPGDPASALQIAQIPRLAQGTTRTKGKVVDDAANVEAGFSAFGSAAGGVGAGIAACWVAAVYFGWFTPDWWAARNWIIDGWKGPDADRMRALYMAHGEEMAEQVQQDDALKDQIRPFFEWARSRGKEMSHGAR